MKQLFTAKRDSGRPFAANGIKQIRQLIREYPEPNAKECRRAKVIGQQGVLDPAPLFA